MSFKKIIVLLVALVMAASFSGWAFAASGEGFFGSGTPDEDVVTDVEDEEDYDDEDDYEDEYEDEDDTTTQTPVLPPIGGDGNTVTQPSSTGQMMTSRSVSDKREKNSEDTRKVINSYGLSASAAKALIARHNEAAKGQGNREKDERYKRILKSNPNDYLAAYRLAQVNMEMGRTGQARTWVNRCLKIFPDYMPARRLRTRLQAPKK